MKFGVREICDVVLRAKATQKIGNKIFYKHEPVIYFDTLKTSSVEGAATQVYAQGGRGNARLVAWEGERTVTFTMEDALISPEGFMILSGAGLVEATAGKPVYQHMTETFDAADGDHWDGENKIVYLSNKPHAAGDGNYIFVMLMKDGEIISEPFIPVHDAEGKDGAVKGYKKDDNGDYAAVTGDEEPEVWGVQIGGHPAYDALTAIETATGVTTHNYELKSTNLGVFDSILVDYYTPKTSYAQQIEITADKFGGNYYLEASTLFRTQDGIDMPAEFIIPNCKIQSNFTFTMASSGDPSTFTFTMDAFPDYTRFDHSKKVLCAIQIIQDAASMDLHRHSTAHEDAHEKLF